MKYNAAGAQQWAARYDNLYDYATDLALDPAGNVADRTCAPAEPATSEADDC